jgi:hypothetical protein
LRNYFFAESLRIRKRLRTDVKQAPAHPTAASNAVGFSGESVHPLWACANRGAASIATTTNAIRTVVLLAIQDTFIACSSFQAALIDR